jgi:hypothetical protein
MQWDPVWRLCRTLGGHFPVMAGEGPRHSHRCGVRGIVYARGVPGHTDYCGTYRSDCHVMSHPVLRPKPDAHHMYAQDQVVIHTAKM